MRRDASPTITFHGVTYDLSFFFTACGICRPPGIGKSSMQPAPTSRTEAIRLAVSQMATDSRNIIMIGPPGVGMVSMTIEALEQREIPYAHVSMFGQPFHDTPYLDRHGVERIARPPLYNFLQQGRVLVLDEMHHATIETFGIVLIEILNGRRGLIMVYKDRKAIPSDLLHTRIVDLADLV